MDLSELGLVSSAVAALVHDIKEDVVALRSKGATDERALLENARATALQVTRLVELVEGRGAALFGAEASEGLGEAAGQLREAVLGLLQSAKSSFEHPLDFVRAQQLADAAHAVQQALIRVEGRFHALSRGLLSVSALAAAYVEKVAEVERVAQRHDLGEGEGEGVALLQAVMREAVLGLKALCDAAPEREEACRELIGATQQLMERVRAYCETQSAEALGVMRAHAENATALAQRLAEGKRELSSGATARELAEEVVEAVVSYAPGVGLEWSLVSRAEQTQVLDTVERLVAEFLRRRVLGAIVPEQQQPRQQEFGPPPPLPVATLPRGRSVTVKATPTAAAARLRATTKGAVESSATMTTKDALVKFLGVNDMRQWNSLLDEGSLVHMGGALGDVQIVRGGGGGKSSCEKIVRDCLAFVLSSSAAALSKKKQSPLEQAKTLAGDVAAAVLAVRQALPEACSPEVEELLVVAAQRAAGFDAATAAPNEHVLSDPEPFRVFSNLLKQVHGCSKQLRAACIHLVTSLQARHKREASERLSERMAAHTPSLVLQIAAAAMALVELIGTLVGVVLTVRSLSSAGVTPPPSPHMAEKGSGEMDFWTERLAAAPPLSSSSSNSSNGSASLPPASPNPVHAGSEQHRKRFAFFRRGEVEADIPKSKSKGDLLQQPGEDVEALPKRGTLNVLVEAATHARLFAPFYMQAFIATLHSFSNSATVLQRLLERYECPASVPAAEREAIQGRVTTVLKHWLETQPDDFDEPMLAKLDRFAKSGAAGADVIAKELARLASNRKNRRAVFEAPPTEFGPLETIGIDSPADLLAKVEPSEIARQLTLIDFSLFSEIESVELQGQVWSRAKVQHRAPHVVALVSRLNKVSYWTATTVLLQDSPEARSAAVARFIEVAKFLRAANNFHTLMGIVAGLNMAAVSKSRLKLTWGRVDPRLLADFEQLETLMSPSSSFKNYRAALKQAKPPAMPYMGSVCGDLTFIDEGNPDTVDGLVNFEKRLQVYQVLQSVGSFARVPYSFPKIEPFHSLFTTLPAFGDKDLYSLSLSIEHRPS